MTDKLKPWHFRHPTAAAIYAGRPVLAEEAFPLLKEIERLEKVERAARTYIRNVDAKRDAGESLALLLGERTPDVVDDEAGNTMDCNGGPPVTGEPGIEQTLPGGTLRHVGRPTPPAGRPFSGIRHSSLDEEPF